MLCSGAVDLLQWQRQIDEALVAARAATRNGADDDQRPRLCVADDYPGLTSLLEVPPIRTIDGFLTAVECEALMRLAPPLLQPSKTSDKVTKIRTSSTGFLPRDAPLSLVVFERAARLLPRCNSGSIHRGFPEFEDLQVARYEPGQRYEGHFDGADPHEPDATHFFGGGGQRVATLLIYLNSLPQEDGGATNFQHVGVRVQPRRGRAILFSPGLLDGTLDKRLWHEAQPARTTKWVAQLWVRQLGDPMRSLPREWFDALHDL
jgi:hypothetical protein